MRLSTCRADFNTVVAVHRGRSLRSLRVVDFNNDGCGRSGGGSMVAFTARRGRSYRIAVAGFTATGRFRLTAKAIAAPRNDDFSDAVPIGLGSAVTATTRNATLELGDPGSLRSQPLTVWFRFRVPEAGEVRLDACDGRAPELSVYKGAPVSRLARVTGFNSCVVRFAARPGVTYRVSADDSGDGGKFRLRARIAKPPPNDDFGAATPIALGTSVQATLRDSSRESGEGAYYFSPFSVWFRLTLGATTTVAVTTSAASSVGCQVFRGDQLKELTPIGAASACFWTAELEPGIYSIQVEGTPSETDFMLSAQAVTPTP